MTGDEPDREERNRRYRAFLCVDCGVVPYSAGRPRCDACHRTHIPNYEPGLPPRARREKAA